MSKIKSDILLGKNNIFLLLFFIAFAGLFSSCKSTKKLSDKNVDKAYKSSKLFNKIKESNVDFEWYSYKADADVFFDRNTISGHLDVRMKKDEFIWMSIKKFGFEVARILIKPDSFYMIDRFNKEYSVKSIDSFKKKYNIPFDFTDIQDILAGNNITKGQKAVSGRKINGKYILKTNSQNLNIVYTLGPDFKVNNNKIKDKNNNEVETKFSTYKIYNNKEIPYLRKYSYPNATNPKYFLNLKIKKLNINIPQKIKFEIPAKYDKV